MKTFSSEDRNQYLQQFENEMFDLVIIGGGINGAGVARDAASRGMKVALIEANDFASGTSSRSSKLIHGGIRYLENLEFHLVFEALSERHKLFEIAPHLVHPLRFMIPMYRHGRVGMTAMGLGMWLYDALALFQAPEMHERLNAIESIERFPLLQAHDLLGSYVYSDAYMDDDRLVIETLRSATMHGALCTNYVKATSAEINAEGKVIAIQAEDQLTKRNIKIKGRHFLSTVGPWTDILSSKMFPNWKKIMRPTKGVHLTFEKKRFPIPHAVVMGAEKRIVFGIPRHEMVIIGTTDTDFSGDPSEVKTTKDDVQYLLQVAQQYFPGAKLNESDIVASYSGVRPLVQDQSESEGKTSREHSIFTEKYGVTFIVGGKYTTYRLIAEQALKEILRHFSIEDRVRFQHGASEKPINPLVTAESFAAREQAMRHLAISSKMTSIEIQYLVERHGDEALEMIKRYGPDLHALEYEALHAIENTMCLNLVDFFLRRTPLFLAEKDHGKRYLSMIQNIFIRQFQLHSDDLKRQVAQLESHLQNEMGWRSRNAQR